VRITQMEVLLEIYTPEVLGENYPIGGLVRDLHSGGLR
jgi:hypothetical protein